MLSHKHVVPPHKYDLDIKRETRNLDKYQITKTLKFCNLQFGCHIMLSFSAIRFFFSIFSILLNFVPKGPIVKIGQHWFSQWFVACLTPCHYLTCWWPSSLQCHLASMIKSDSFKARDMVDHPSMHLQNNNINIVKFTANQLLFLSDNVWTHEISLMP